MMYFIERVNTWKATNQKVAELNNYVKQYDKTLIVDDISRDALVEELRHKVEELNEAYPKTKKLVVGTIDDNFVYCEPMPRKSDSDVVFSFLVWPVRRTYRFAEAPTEAQLAKNREAAAYLDSFGSNEPTTNPRRTHDEASDAKGGAL